MITLHPENVSFSESDFRKYNEAGYGELFHGLQTARRKVESAATIEEKKTAQIHLESVEQLWRLSLQLAKERFSHARDNACHKLQALVGEVRRAGVVGRSRKDLILALGRAADAFHAKDFEQAQKLVGWIRSSLTERANHLRLVPAVRQATETTPPLPAADVVELLERALEAERNNRTGQAYRLYLQVLERQPSNAGALQRVRVVGRAGRR